MTPRSCMRKSQHRFLWMTRLIGLIEAIILWAYNVRIRGEMQIIKADIIMEHQYGIRRRRR